MQPHFVLPINREQSLELLDFIDECLHLVAIKMR
jgi:hypothetical protein